MSTESSRREFIKQSGAAALAITGAALMSDLPIAAAGKRSYDISLAAWSLHRTIGKGEGQMPMLDMPKYTQDEFGIGAIELVSGMLASTEKGYLDELAKNAAANNVKILLIMVDGQGAIGADSDNARERAVENHKKYIDYAADFGCHSIRMNWQGAPKDAEKDPSVMDAFVALSAPGFHELCEYGESKNINVILENHWGPSSYPEALEKLVKAVAHPRFGTLPDFGNFPEDVDKYQAVDAMMPFAKAVSAKCYDFDPATGLETKIDFPRMMEIVCDKHAYKGFVGIEYEGNDMPEPDGIKACKALLEKLKV